MNGDAKLKGVKIDEVAGQQLDAICARERRTLGGQLALLIAAEFRRLDLKIEPVGDKVEAA